MASKYTGAKRRRVRAHLLSRSGSRASSRARCPTILRDGSSSDHGPAPAGSREFLTTSTAPTGERHVRSHLVAIGAVAGEVRPSACCALASAGVSRRGCGTRCPSFHSPGIRAPGAPPVNANSDASGSCAIMTARRWSGSSIRRRTGRPCPARPDPRHDGCAGTLAKRGRPGAAGPGQATVPRAGRCRSSGGRRRRGPRAGPARTPAFGRDSRTGRRRGGERSS